MGKLNGRHPCSASYVEDYSQPLLIKENTDRMAMLVSGGKQLSSVTQKFFFNKATGKITLITPADKKYPGDGAFYFGKWCAE